MYPCAMFCQKCGTEVDSTRGFCVKCGARLASGAVESQPHKIVCPNCNTESGPSLFCYVCDAYLPSVSGGAKASLPSRFGAFLLDGLVFLTLLLIIISIVVSAGIDASSFGLEAFLIVFFGGGFGYSLLSLWLLARGQTPGKWLMDIRAVDKRNGSEPGLGRMLFRETLGKWVSGCFFGLGWFWAIWDRDAQAWHDKISRTVVLYRRAQSRKLLFLGFLLGALILSVGFARAVIIDARSMKAARAFRGNFTTEKAFAALFGNYDTSDQSSSVIVTEDNFDFSRHRGKLTLILDSPFSQGGVEKHLLVTATAIEGEDCHDCPAQIGAYVFAKLGRRWTPEIADKEVDQFGAFGHAFGIPDHGHPNGDEGSAQAVKFAPNVYGFSLTHSDGQQGIGGTFELFVAPVENHYQPVLSQGIEGDNGGACGPESANLFRHAVPCYGFKSTVRFLSSVHAGFFDIEVDQAGTEDSDQGIIPANNKKLYFFSGDKYEPTIQPI